MASTFRLHVNGVDLAVTDDPEARDRPAMVFAHATGFCGAVWEPIAQCFRDRFRVVVFDQRGHGDSDKPAGPYEWRSFVDDLAGLIDALELRDVVAIGHSKGGAAVAGVAAQEQPRIARAVLLDPVLMPRLDPGIERPSSNALAESARRRRMVWASRAEMLESYSSRPPFGDWDPRALRAYVEHGTFVLDDGRVQLKCPGEVEAQIYEGGARSASLEYLPRISVPTLLVTGGASSTLPPELARSAAATMSDVRLHVLPGVGHFVPMQAPNDVSALVRAFLAETGAG
jgi:pimeloyl-ACP methyl ester carboxylesterase